MDLPSRHFLEEILNEADVLGQAQGTEMATCSLSSEIWLHGTHVLEHIEVAAVLAMRMDS